MEQGCVWCLGWPRCLGWPPKLLSVAEIKPLGLVICCWISISTWVFAVLSVFFSVKIVGKFQWTSVNRGRMNLICTCVVFECSLSRLLFTTFVLSSSESTCNTLAAWGEASLSIWDFAEVTRFAVLLAFDVLRFDIVVPRVCLISLDSVEPLVVKRHLLDLWNSGWVDSLGHITTRCFSQIKRA